MTFRARPRNGVKRLKDRGFPNVPNEVCCTCMPHCDKALYSPRLRWNNAGKKGRCVKARPGKVHPPCGADIGSRQAGIGETRQP